MADGDFDRASGDGGSRKVSPAWLADIKSEATAVSTIRRQVSGARSNMEDVRFCQWAGQSDDGRKHAEQMSGEDPFPFEGATDTRVRMADEVVNDDVRLYVMATMLARLQVIPVEGTDVQRAKHMGLLMRWVLNSELGWRYVREVMKLAQYVTADSPAVAMMAVRWRRVERLELREVTWEDLKALYMEQALLEVEEQGGDEEQAQRAMLDAVEELGANIENAEFGDEPLAEALLSFFPEIKPSRARAVVRGLRKEGSAEFPLPYVDEGPELRALRLYEDFYVPENTRDPQSARVWFEPELLSRVDGLARARSEKWDKAFVDAVFGTRTAEGGWEGGQEAVVQFSSEDQAGASGARPSRTTGGSEAYAGEFELVTAFMPTINDEGIAGVHFVVFHMGVDVPAHELRLLNYRHGKMPGHVFQREVLNDRLLDSRGVVELVSTDQELVKLFQDSGGDVGQLSGAPPVVTRNRQSEGDLYIEPLVELQARGNGDYKWMDPPPYPKTLLDLLDRVMDNVDSYHGRPNAKQDPARVLEIRRFKAMWWLVNHKESMVQLAQLLQQFAPDSLLQRVVNEQGEPLIRSREDIQGQFDLQVSFDPAHSDPEEIKALGEFVRDVITPLDNDKQLSLGPVVEHLVALRFPELANVALRDVEAADQSEIEDEWKQYLKILGGDEPELPDNGSVNYERRLAFYEELQQKNPAVFDSLPPDRQEILQSRLQRLETQSQQFGENRQIGREGGKRALEQ